MLRKVLGAERSKHLPPIKRGSCADVYLTSSGQEQMVSFTRFHMYFFPVLQEMKTTLFLTRACYLWKTSPLNRITLHIFIYYFMFIWIINRVQNKSENKSSRWCVIDFDKSAISHRNYFEQNSLYVPNEENKKWNQTIHWLHANSFYPHTHT